MSSSYRNVTHVLVRRALPALGAAAMSVASPLALGQAWELDPRIEVEGIYDDNYRLTDQPGQEIEVSGGALDAQLTARKQGQAFVVEASPRIRSSFFPGDSSEESTDYFFNGKAERNTQRLKTGVRLQFADESVVTSELLAADFPGVDLGQAVGGDGGVVSIRNRRRLISLLPSVAFDWTERRQVTFDAHYSDAAYDNDLFEQVGFTDIGGGVGMAWDTTERSRFSISALYSQYSPDDDTEDTNSTGLVAEWRMSPSEVMEYYFRVGGNRSERDATATTDDVSASSFNGGAGVAWNFQVTRIVIDALRTTVPSSQGTIVDRDELRFRAVRAFSPRVSGFLALRGIRTEGLDEAGTNVRDRKYYTGRAGFEWRLSRPVSLEGAYEYKWQEYEDQLDNATSNGVTLSVVYQPRRRN
jgi:hypothetical protein